MMRPRFRWGLTAMLIALVASATPAPAQTADDPNLGFSNNISNTGGNQVAPDIVDFATTDHVLTLTNFDMNAGLAVERLIVGTDASPPSTVETIVSTNFMLSPTHAARTAINSYTERIGDHAIVDTSNGAIGFNRYR